MAPSKNIQSGKEKIGADPIKVNVPKSAPLTTQPDKVVSSPVGSGEDPKTILDYTPKEEIPVLVKKLRDNYHAELKTHSIQFRLNQLRNIYFAIKDNVDDICDALRKDFGRAPTETINLEYAPLMKEIVHIMAHLHEWVRPEPVTNLPISMKMDPIYIEKEPLGVVLIISPFNYPLLLSVSSLIAAIAAGNSVVLKVSEFTPHFAKLLTTILVKALDPTTFAMVNGGIEESTALLDQKYDKIMYTGSIPVGTIIAKKAAETLTPVLLELGGKSPAFVLDDVTDADITTVARRIAWGRFTNAGQTCVAVDYVLVPEKLKDKLVNAIVKVVNEDFYPTLDSKDPSYTHIIHLRAFETLKKMIQLSKGTIVAGGQTDSSHRYIAPTVIDNVDWEDSTMQQEIFGPVLPILTYSDLKLAVKEVVKRHDTPLALYIFTSGSTRRSKNTQVDYIRSAVRSGGTIVNDSILHVGLDNAPFGGVGTSGQGAYHGYFSFRAFTHERTTMEQNLKMDFALKVRYPPYGEKKSKAVSQAQTSYNGSVWFSRTGNVAIRGPGLIWSSWTSLLGVGALIYLVVNAI
ncbi:CIC11C00000004033 [Sungouiella intermedia]|uniref:CIC11C00000004033 n=1 Tax=Sungouiella intermedia TaxID=45354 RepID=A0A1L0BJH3_9ASCO|nr:CIC11C00000004033 [[Candida] intermedia]